MTKNKARQKWTYVDLKFLRDNYLKLSKKEMSEYLGRTEDGVVKKCIELNLEYPTAKIGDKFNRLEIKDIFMEEKYGQQRSIAICVCDCGNLTNPKLTDVFHGRVKSCGCLWKEKIKQNGKKTHGMSRRPLYTKWNNLRKEGDLVCKLWWDDFTSFYNWATENGYEKGLVIDRKDYNLGYSPENCFWSTKSEKRNKRACTRLITAFGETKNIKAWMKDERCLIKSECSIRTRLKQGWEPEKAISEPPRKNVWIEYQGERKTLSEWVKDDRCVVKDSVTLYARIFMYNWKIDLAFTIPVDKHSENQ